MTVEFPDELFIKPKSFIIQPQDLSESRISPIYKLNDGKISSISEINYYNDNIISASIVPNVSDSKSVANFSGLKNIIYNRIWRYSGFYSPIFLEIDLFDRGGEENPLQNFKFNTNLTSFGKIKEKINSKVNRKSNILKLRNDSDLKSQYPMLDEFGYGVNDFFIFKSN